MNNQFANWIDRFAMFHVWIHSSELTEKPYCVDVLEVSGKINIQWFYEVFEKNNGQDLAQEFYDCLGKTEDSAWFLVCMETETASGIPEHYPRIVSLIN